MSVTRSRPAGKPLWTDSVPCRADGRQNTPARSSVFTASDEKQTSTTGRQTAVETVAFLVGAILAGGWANTGTMPHTRGGRPYSHQPAWRLLQGCLSEQFPRAVIRPVRSQQSPLPVRSEAPSHFPSLGGTRATVAGTIDRSGPTLPVPANCWHHPIIPVDAIKAIAANTAEPQTTNLCPCCGGRMVIVERFERRATPHYRASPPPAISIDTS